MTTQKTNRIAPRWGASTFDREREMQQRMMNCIKARSQCDIGSWSYNFWDSTLESIIRINAREDKMTKRDWYNLYNLQPDGWRRKNSTRKDGLFTPFKQRIMKLVLRDRDNTAVY